MEELSQEKESRYHEIKDEGIEMSPIFMHVKQWPVAQGLWPCLRSVMATVDGFLSKAFLILRKQFEQCTSSALS